MCTTIKLEYPGGSMLARNMDWDSQIEYQILYIPEDTVFAQDLNGNDLKNRYRMLGTCFRNWLPLKDGVNEHGLMGCSNMFIKLGLFSSELKDNAVNLKSLDFLNYALGNFRNVRELKEALPHIHLSTKDKDGNKVRTPDFHYLFMDREGNSCILEVSDRELKFHEDRYGIMTNSPEIEKHYAELEKTFRKEGRPFNPSKDLPGGYDPVSRFIKAYYIKSSIDAPESLREATETAFSILDGVKIPEAVTRTKFDHTYTRYTTVFDSENRVLNIKTARNPKVFTLSLDDLKDRKEPLFIEVPQKLQKENILTGKIEEP